MSKIIDEFLVTMPRAHLDDMTADLKAREVELKDVWAHSDNLADRLEDAHATIAQLKQERDDLRLQKRILIRQMGHTPRDIKPI